MKVLLKLKHPIKVPMSAFVANIVVLIGTKILQKEECLLTKNQLEYLKLLETQRSNRENERLTGERDRVTKELGFGNLAENMRSNRAKEAQQVAVLGETQRSNLAQEELKRISLDETSRSNQANERLKEQSNKIAGYNFLEIRRSNKAREQETNRANLAKEAETKRSNLAQEAENYRVHSLNDIREGQRIDLAYGTLNEQIRNNNLNYDVSTQRNLEQYRHNLASEIETKRSNEENERIVDSNNTTRNLETQRHDKATEANDKMRTAVYMVSEGFDIGNQFVRTTLTPFGVMGTFSKSGGNNNGKQKKQTQATDPWSWPKQKLSEGPDFGPEYRYYYLE